MTDAPPIDPDLVDELDRIESGRLAVSAEAWRRQGLGRLASLLADELVRRHPHDPDVLRLRARYALEFRDADTLDWLRRARLDGASLDEVELGSEVLILVSQGRFAEAEFRAARFQTTSPRDVEFAMQFLEATLTSDPEELESARSALAGVLGRAFAQLGGPTPPLIRPPIDPDALAVRFIEGIDSAVARSFLDPGRASAWIDRLVTIGGPNAAVEVALRRYDADPIEAMEIIRDAVDVEALMPVQRARLDYLRADIDRRAGRTRQAMAKMRGIVDHPWSPERQRSLIAEFAIEAGSTTEAWVELRALEAELVGLPLTLDGRLLLRTVRWRLLDLTYDRGDFDRYWGLLDILSQLKEDEQHDEFARVQTAIARVLVSRHADLQTATDAMRGALAPQVDWSTAFGANRGALLIEGLRNVALRRPELMAELRSQVRQAVAELPDSSSLRRQWLPYLFLQIDDGDAAARLLASREFAGDEDSVEHRILKVRAQLATQTTGARALQVAHDVLRESPDRLGSRLLLAECMIADGRLEDAYLQLDQVCHEAPRLVPARLWRAETAFLLAQSAGDAKAPSESSIGPDRATANVGSVQLLTRAAHDYAKALELSDRTERWLEASESTRSQFARHLGSNVIPRDLIEHVARRGAHAAIRAEEALVAARLRRDRELRADGFLLAARLSAAGSGDGGGLPPGLRRTARGKSSDGLHAEGIRLRTLLRRPRARWWRQRIQKVATPILVIAGLGVLLWAAIEGRLGDEALALVEAHGGWLLAAGAVLIVWPYVREFEFGGVSFSKDVVAELDSASERVVAAFLAKNPYGRTFRDLPFPRGTFADRTSRVDGNAAPSAPSRDESLDAVEGTLDGSKPAGAKTARRGVSEVPSPRTREVPGNDSAVARNFLCEVCGQTTVSAVAPFHHGRMMKELHGR